MKLVSGTWSMESAVFSVFIKGICVPYTDAFQNNVTKSIPHTQDNGAAPCSCENEFSTPRRVPTESRAKRNERVYVPQIVACARR